MVWQAVLGSIAGAAAGKLLDKSMDGGSDVTDANAAIQREFAQQGVRWRVADAQAAGVHPLFALGAQLPGYQPVHQVGSESSVGALSAVGQDIGRAVDGTRTPRERAAARLEALSLERGELENELLRSRIAILNQQSGPPMVDPANPGVRVFGTSDARIEEKPLERITAAPGAAHQEAGAVTDLGFSRTPTGFAILPSKDWKDRGEDQLFPEVAWAVRNHILPTLSPSRFGMPPPETWLPEGATHWGFSRLKQEWQPVFPVRRRAGSWSLPESMELGRTYRLERR